MDNLSSFYLSKAEPNRSCFLALREIILEQNQNLSETRKYGMPCFCFGKKHLCYLWQDKLTDEPYILFVDGNKIDHPALELGKRARMKILRVPAHKDLELETVLTILHKAIALHT